MLAPSMTIETATVICLTNFSLLRVSSGREAHKNAALLGVTSGTIHEEADASGTKGEL